MPGSESSLKRALSPPQGERAVPSSPIVVPGRSRIPAESGYWLFICFATSQGVPGRILYRPGFKRVSMSRRENHRARARASPVVSPCSTSERETDKAFWPDSTSASIGEPFPSGTILAHQAPPRVMIAPKRKRLRIAMPIPPRRITGRVFCPGTNFRKVASAVRLRQ